MTTQLNPGRITTGPNGQPVIAGPWPSYRQFRDLPERERWVLYGHGEGMPRRARRPGLRHGRELRRLREAGN